MTTLDEARLAQKRPDARVVGARVEALLEELRSSRDPRAAGLAEEMVRCVVDLYGAALTTIVDLASTQPAGDAVLAGLLDDPLVESLLLVHDLHPLDVDTRIQRALDRVRPYLGSHAGGVGYEGVSDDGIVHMTLQGSCNGCPSSTVTVKLAIEQAVMEAAPETTGVEVVGMVAEPASPLLQITPRPPDGWTRLPAPRTGEPTAATIDGLAVVMLRLGGEPYAYRDRCPGCEGAVSSGTLDGDVLACAGCGQRYDVRHAGAGLDQTDLHLVPLPLLADARGLRIAVGAGAPS